MVLDPRDTEGPGDSGPMTVEIPGKTALLLVTIARDIGVHTPGEVIQQALGLMQLVRQAKQRGQRVILRDPSSGSEIDLAL